MNPWMDVAIAATLFAAGSVVFGHFEAGTPAWRRLIKLCGLLAVTWGLARTAGDAVAIGLLTTVATVGLTGHFVYLRRHGINPWTAEPRDKYYALRGWSR
jgi:hypothetical protein